MKKVLAIFLSALLICISIAPMSFAVSDPGLTTRVMEGKYDSTDKGVSAVTKTTFTIAVKVPAVKKLVGVNLYFSFDPSVLSVVEANLAGYTDAEDTYIKYFNGIDVTGFKTESNKEYSFGWISDSGVTKNSAKDFAYITFAVLDTTKTETSINLYIDEFRTDDGDDSNDVTSTLLEENKIVNFNFPVDTPPETSVTESTTGGSGSGTTADDINGLLQIIRDMLSGNGATFGDFVDAIANLLGNADIADMIEMIVDGNIDISEFFQNILDGLGLDFGSLEDLLNKIIEFFKNLFGGKDDPATTTTPGTTYAGGVSEEEVSTVTTTTSSANLDTTSGGSISGSEKTGDSGVGIAAAVCVMASAAFVLTRKKKETV